MPEGNEGEYKDAGRSKPMRATEWNVDVAYNPKVIGAMP